MSNERDEYVFENVGGAVHRGFFSRQIGLHCLKLLRNRCHPFMKLRAGEILKDSRFLIVLSAQSQSGLT